MTAQRFEKKLFKPGGLAEAVQLVFFFRRTHTHTRPWRPSSRVGQGRGRSRHFISRNNRHLLSLKLDI